MFKETFYTNVKREPEALDTQTNLGQRSKSLYADTPYVYLQAVFG